MASLVSPFQSPGMMLIINFRINSANWVINWGNLILFTGHRSNLLHPWSMACSHSDPIFFTSPLGFCKWYGICLCIKIFCICTNLLVGVLQMIHQWLDIAPSDILVCLTYMSCCFSSFLFHLILPFLSRIMNFQYPDILLCTYCVCICLFGCFCMYNSRDDFIFNHIFDTAKP